MRCRRRCYCPQRSRKGRPAPMDAIRRIVGLSARPPTAFPADRSEVLEHLGPLAGGRSCTCPARGRRRLDGIRAWVGGSGWYLPLRLGRACATRCRPRLRRIPCFRTSRLSHILKSRSAGSYQNPSLNVLATGLSSPFNSFRLGLQHRIVLALLVEPLRRRRQDLAGRVGDHSPGRPAKWLEERGDSDIG